MLRLFLWVFLGVNLVGFGFAAPSGGCTSPAPLPLSAQSGVQSIRVGGQQRNYLVSVSESYDAAAPHALVLAFHGRTSPAAEVQGYYDLESYATSSPTSGSGQDGLGPTIFAYPVALTQADGTFGWWNPGEAPDALRDFALFDALVERFSADACLDTTKIFAVGHSLGGSFVNALGCHRAAVLRGVASLGGGPAAGTCQGEVAAMVLHNPNDQLVPFELGVAARDQFLAQNGRTGPPAPSAPRSLNCERYGASGVTNPVLWCPHTQDYAYGGRYYPHNWPNETGAAVMHFFALLPEPELPEAKRP